MNHVPSATMGNDVEMLTSATAGVIQVSATRQGAMSQIVPEVGLLGLPFLFKNLPTAWTILDGEVGDLNDQRAQAAGLALRSGLGETTQNCTLKATASAGESSAACR